MDRTGPLKLFQMEGGVRKTLNRNQPAGVEKAEESTPSMTRVRGAAFKVSS